MRKSYKYDIAISVAEEDLSAALQIAAALKIKGIKYYLYTEHRAANFGKPIMSITREVYEGLAKYVLMITSKSFVIKYWAGVEAQLTQYYARDKEAYILQLRLDDTPVDGLSRHTVFEKWNNNPAEIAAIIAEKLALVGTMRARQELKPGVRMVLLILFVTISITVLITWHKQEMVGIAAMSKMIVNPVPQNPVATSDTVIKEDVKHNTKRPTTSDITIANNMQTDTIAMMQDSLMRTDTDKVQLPLNEELIVQFSCCVVVEGSDTTFSKMVDNKIKAYSIPSAVKVSDDGLQTIDTVRLFLITSSHQDAENGDIYTTCKYTFHFVNDGASVSGETSESGADEATNFAILSLQIVKKVNEFINTQKSAKEAM
jgi:hypothetical protein